MRTPSSLLAVVAVSAAALACGGSPADEAVDASATSSAAVKATTPWTFTKLPAPWARHAVAAPVQGLDALVFEMGVSGVKDARVTGMAFMVTGTVQTGDLVNFQLVFYPDGLAKPGVVVGTNDGATWAPGPTASTVGIVLTTPIGWKKNFKGDFILRADVNGGRTFFFQPQLQTVTVQISGVEQLLVGATCDLPLPGDSFYVN